VGALEVVLLLDELVDAVAQLCVVRVARLDAPAIGKIFEQWNTLAGAYGTLRLKWRAPPRRDGD
jgi:hypothetical protein